MPMARLWWLWAIAVIGSVGEQDAFASRSGWVSPYVCRLIIRHADNRGGGNKRRRAVLSGPTVQPL